MDEHVNAVDAVEQGDEGGEEKSSKEERTDSGWQKLAGWLARWGFSLLVLFAALGAIYVAWRVHVPKHPPDFALEAASVYRVEVGAATFVGLYLVAMALVLAFHNRGFSEIGVNGLKAQDMANKAQQDAIQSHEDSLEILGEMVDEIEASTEASVRDLQVRLKALEGAQAGKRPMA